MLPRSEEHPMERTLVRNLIYTSIVLLLLAASLRTLRNARRPVDFDPDTQIEWEDE